MSIGPHTTTAVFVPRAEVVAGSGPALLVALARAARERPEQTPEPLASALDEIGDTAGEAWLNLLGVPIDAGGPYTVARLLDALAMLEGVELRRHLLGRYAWSWCAVAGADVIEAAAAGDGAAARKLLEHPRYYAGHASDSLHTLLRLDGDETRRRVIRAVEAGAEALVDERTASALVSAEDEAMSAISELGPIEAIERLTNGYRYVPEPEADRVLLLPHLELTPQLVLAQHRDARIVAYRAGVEPAAEERLLALGRALSDPKRVEILGLVARGTVRVPDLVERTGLSRSTVHHHLSQLRDAGLVTLEGNARAYTFAIRRESAATAAALLADVLGAPATTT